MYSLEYSKDIPRVLEKSGSTIGQKTEEGPCIDKHTHKNQILPSDSFYYSPPTLSDVEIHTIKSESTNFGDLLKKASDCTDISCPSGIYFVDGGDSTSLFNLGTKIGGPQNTMEMGKTSEWSTSRYAILVGEGTYKMSDLFKLGYYTQVSGVGSDKSAVSIAPGINVLNNCAKSGDPGCVAPGGLDNFWRSMSDLTITGNDKPLVFAVSQASPIRDVTIEGDQGILMCDWHTTTYDCGQTSGGFIDGMKASKIGLGSQQQFYVSNSDINELQAGVWNIVSNNNKGTVKGEGDSGTQNKWNGYPFTEMKDGTLAQFKKPKLVKNGDEWQVKYNDKAASVNDFIILKLNQNEDRTKISSSDIQKINSDLGSKAGIIVMPGIYDLEDTLNIPNNKIVLGLGLPSFVCPPTTGKCMITASEGVRVSGLVFDAPEASNFDTNKDAVLLNIGEKGSGTSTNPTILQDVYCRIAHIEKGQSDASAYSCIKVNADYTIGENLWLWRADHDAKFVNVLADTAKAPYGLVVYGNNVKMYGLFVEHFQNYQTVWYGKSGQINFYQSEMPYYLPKDGVSKCFLPDSNVMDTTPVCSSLYIAESAAGFRGQGLGIYSYFPNANTNGQKAGETPFTQGTIRAKTAITIDAEDVVLTHGLTHFLDGDLKSGIDNIITYKSKLYPENSAVNGDKKGYGFDEFKTSEQTKLSYKKKAVNEANNKILAAIDYDKLEQKYHPDIIEKAVNTALLHGEPLSVDYVEKLAKSHEVYSKPDYTSSDVEHAEICIVHGLCE